MNPKTDDRRVLAATMGSRLHLIPARERRPSILLIAGNPSFREQFKLTLEAAGYTVDTAETGQQGLHAAFALRPDAIVVSGLQPGIDGHTVIQRLKQDVTLRNTPCLLLTAWRDLAGEVGVLDDGADAYLSKQAGSNLILARIAALLRSGGKPRPVDASASSVLGARKILAVHASALFLEEVSAELRADGFDVIAVRSGNDALEWLERRPVDCMVVDAALPDLAGCEVCRIVKNRPAWRPVAVLLLTSTGEPEEAVAGLLAGADDCAPVSSGLALLKARVRVQLRRKQFEDQDRIIHEELRHRELQSAQTRDLEQRNSELEAFAHAVSHDLRSPLRTIRGFTQALLEDFDGQLPAAARDHLVRVMAGALRMSKLIDTLLELSRSSRVDLRRQAFDLSCLARSVANELAESDRRRQVDCSVQECLPVTADPALIRIVLENLMGNAWKFTAKAAHPAIEVGALSGNGGPVYFVRDNGAGFDAARAQRLFQPFERLHAATDFPGTGIGLSTTRRIVERHGGEIWAESTPAAGATFFFTLAES